MLTKKSAVILICLISLVFSFAGSSQALQNQDKVDILFIGNSLTYTNDMPAKFNRIAENKGKKVNVKQVCHGGHKLKHHWKYGKAAKKIKAKKWDYVVLQEHGAVPLQDKKEFYKYVKLFNQKIKSVGAQTVLYITARSANKQGKAVGVRQEPLTHTYEKIADQLDALVVPAGPAWVAANRVDFELSFYKSDNLHPSNLGAYLTACVFYSTLFEETPSGAEGGSYRDKNLEANREKLQKMAWQVVKDYSFSYDQDLLTGITKNGRQIILNSDNTWNYSWEWGMNQQELINRLGEPEGKARGKSKKEGEIIKTITLHYRDSYFNIPCMIFYSFNKEKDSLCSVGYAVADKYLTNIDHYRLLKAKLFNQLKRAEKVQLKKKKGEVVKEASQITNYSFERLLSHVIKNSNSSLWWYKRKIHCSIYRSKENSKVYYTIILNKDESN